MTANAFPVPDLNYPALQPFWAAAAEGRLSLPRCRQCARFNWYPAEQCIDCGGETFDWQDVAPRGRLFSWSVVERGLHPGYAGLTPFVPALVTLDEAPTVRLVTRLLEADPATLDFNQPVTLVFEDLGYPNITTGVCAPLARLAG